MCSLSLSQSSASKHSCTMAFNTRPVEGASEACSGMNYNVGGGGGGNKGKRGELHWPLCDCGGDTGTLESVPDTEWFSYM